MTIRNSLDLANAIIQPIQNSQILSEIYAASIFDEQKFAKRSVQKKIALFLLETSEHGSMTELQRIFDKDLSEFQHHLQADFRRFYTGSVTLDRVLLPAKLLKVESMTLLSYALFNAKQAHLTSIRENYKDILEYTKKCQTVKSKFTTAEFTATFLKLAEETRLNCHYNLYRRYRLSSPKRASDLLDTCTLLLNAAESASEMFKWMRFSPSASQKLLEACIDTLITLSHESEDFSFTTSSAPDLHKIAKLIGQLGGRAATAKVSKFDTIMNAGKTSFRDYQPPATEQSALFSTYPEILGIRADLMSDSEYTSLINQLLDSSSFLSTAISSQVLQLEDIHHSLHTSSKTSQRI